MKTMVINPVKAFTLIALGLATAVASNIAHANTSSLALRVGAAFEKQIR